MLLKSFYLAVAMASLTSRHKTHRDPLDLLQRPKDPPCLLMHSTISRTPLVPEGGVPMEKGEGEVGVDFFLLYNLQWLDSSDCRLVC